MPFEEPSRQPNFNYSAESLTFICTYIQVFISYIMQTTVRCQAKYFTRPPEISSRTSMPNIMPFIFFISLKLPLPAAVINQRKLGMKP